MVPGPARLVVTLDDPFIVAANMRLHFAPSVLLTLVSLARAAKDLSPRLANPIDGDHTYLMSSSFGGDAYYLGCGDDNECSILGIDGAQLHDGWTPHDNGDGTWEFAIRDDSWYLDVHSNGVSVFANPTHADNLLSQRWTLFSWPDGTYNLNNSFWDANLDVKDSTTPFANNFTGDNSALLGQRWYFQTIAPQTTVVSTTVFKSVQNAQATSTTTVTITTCAPGANKRDAEPTPLAKRATGSAILETTTQTKWVTNVVVVTSLDGTQVQTSTQTVFSCAPTTVVVTSGESTAAPTTTPSGTSGAAGATTTPSSAVHSFQAGVMGWIFMLWISIGAYNLM